MRRRDLLRTGVAAVGLSVLGDAASAHPGPYRPYGRVGIPGAREAVVGPDGETAYVAATNGYAVVDVSVADRPRLLAERRNLLADRDGGPLREIYDVKVDGDRLVVVGPANPLPGALAGVLVADVSDPTEPRTVAFHETDFAIHNCFLDGDYAYLTATDFERNPLVAVDVGGDEPAEVGRWSLLDHDRRWEAVAPELRVLHDVRVRDGVAYAPHWDAGTWLLDVSDPSSPAYLGRVAEWTREELASVPPRRTSFQTRVPPGNDHYAATDESGTLLGIGREAWAVSPDGGSDGDDGGGDGRDDGRDLIGGPGGIDLWDVSDPTDPVRRSTIDPPPSPDPTFDGVWTTSHNFELRDGVLYSSWYRGGVKRHDVSDPSDPIEEMWWREPDEASFWTARVALPGETFVASATDHGGGPPGALYVFPDHAGEQANPPSLGAGRRGNDSTRGASSDSPSRTGGGTAGGDAGAADRVGETGALAPGFGAGSALAGLGIGAWWVRRRVRSRGGRDDP
ncbi:LVIVD repeat-containing protein [Halegenticoccus soli]|uniref:LVIVD repeat-containing protein n=1 Tax=Halegenticoccus soli TaxID=1985678 RepID=UPI000C6D42DF|nr:hypothetical protein [Halegenticoccus soli]